MQPGATLFEQQMRRDVHVQERIFPIKEMVGRSIHLYRIANHLRALRNPSKDCARLSQRKIKLPSERRLEDPAEILEKPRLTAGLETPA